MSERPPGRTRTLALALAAVAAAVTGCSAVSSPSRQDVPAQQLTVIDAARRQQAPAISAPDLDGRTTALGDFNGKVVVLNVWGSWCGPCRAEADDLEKAARATRERGVQFLGIDTRDQRIEAPRAFVDEHAISYPNLYDPSGALLLRFPASVLNPQAIPSTLIVDRHGRIAVSALRPVTAEQLQTALETLLKEPA